MDLSMEKLDALLAQTRAIKPPGHLFKPPVSERHWDEAVGSRIAQRTRPWRLERGVLHVRVANAAWANELALLADDILAQLQRRGISATALRFSVAPVAPPSRLPTQGRAKQAPPDNAELPPSLVPAVERIEDDELRTAISRAAAKSLALSKDE